MEQTDDDPEKEVAEVLKKLVNIRTVSNINTRGLMFKIQNEYINYNLHPADGLEERMLEDFRKIQASHYTKFLDILAGESVDSLRWPSIWMVDKICQIVTLLLLVYVGFCLKSNLYIILAVEAVALIVTIITIIHLWCWIFKLIRVACYYEHITALINGEQLLIRDDIGSQLLKNRALSLISQQESINSTGFSQHSMFFSMVLTVLISILWYQNALLEPPLDLFFIVSASGATVIAGTSVLYHSERGKQWINGSKEPSNFYRCFSFLFSLFLI